MRALFATLLLALTGCTSDDERSLDWVVTSHRGMGRKYSALTHAGADSLVGRTIHLGTPAISEDDRCERPEIVERHVMAGPFMAVEYDATAGSLGINQTDSVSVVEVVCDGSQWSALGGKVIFISEALGYAPWENRLFVVRPKQTR